MDKYRNIDPKLWGSSAWHFLHYVTFAYPEKPTKIQKENMTNFFTNIGNVLPCESCRQNYVIELKNNPIKVNSRDELVAWLVEIHNSVSKRTHSPQFTLEEIKKIYDVSEICYDKCKPSSIEEKRKGKKRITSL